MLLGMDGYSAVTRDCRYAQVRVGIVYQRDTHKIDNLKSLQKELGGTAEQLFPINIYTRARVSYRISCSTVPPILTTEFVGSFETDRLRLTMVYHHTQDG